MTPEMIKAAADLAWPLLAAALLFALIPIIRSVAKSRAFTIKYGEMELSVQDASDQLRKQVEDLQTQVQALQRMGVGTQSEVAERGEGAPAAPRRSILWVDDKPQNNAHEISKLQDDGWEIVPVSSTAEALEFLRTRSTPPTAIVSDMARREGFAYRRSAGLDLIREARAASVQVPIFIYAAGDLDKYRRPVVEAGGNGITASPIELFRMLASAG